MINDSRQKEVLTRKLELSSNVWGYKEALKGLKSTQSCLGMSRGVIKCCKVSGGEGLVESRGVWGLTSRGVWSEYSVQCK